MNLSCLISCYHKDSPSQLRESLNSIEKQTLMPNEVVLVEDGPLPNSLCRVIEEFASLIPIKRIRLSENKGLGNALNIGLGECSGDIVMRMDADDICLPTRFERQFNFLRENREVSIVGSWVKDINERGKVIGERIFPTKHADIADIIWSCPFAHPTIAFRKDAIIAIGSYRTDIKRRQDYDLWMRAAIKGLKFANIPEFLLYYRFTDDYYKKNNLKVAWSQAKMGFDGLRNLREKRLYPYVAVFSPVFRAILPSFIEKPVHNLLKSIDPRRLKVNNLEQ